MPRPRKKKKERTRDVTTQKVTVSRLPVIRCAIRDCNWSRAIRPGQDASQILTRHYEDKHG